MLMDMMARAQVAVPARSTPPADTVTSVVRSSVSPPPSAREYVMQLAEARGLTTLAAIARASGTDPASLSRWLAGHNGATIQSLRQLSDALGTRLVDMIVAFGVASADELGMQPLPMEVQEVMHALADDSFTAREKRGLLIGVSYAYKVWEETREEQREARREPKMRSRDAKR